MNPHEIIDQRKARAQGLKYFYTGRPCKYGHYAQRYSSSGQCIECRNWSSKIGATTSCAPNLFWLPRPMIFSGFDPPSDAEFQQVQQLIYDSAIGFLAAVRNRKGQAMKGTEGRARIVIEGHECALFEEIQGRQFWWPVYMDAVREDRRVNPGALQMLADDTLFTGIWWDRRLSMWMVSHEDPTTCHTFIMTPEQMRQIKR